MEDFSHGGNEMRVNDFCMTVCTVNGSGSATANNTLLRAMFHMGIPVSGKNIFPSNIKGLPTWFSIRASKDGYIGRVAHDDIIVQMNQGTLNLILITMFQVGWFFMGITSSYRLIEKTLLYIPCLLKN
jgi:Pyruvate/2-oxoacid:ferredoxin oxidoreductase gamma subunit